MDNIEFYRYKLSYRIVFIYDDQPLQCEALRQSLLMRYYDRSQPRNNRRESQPPAASHPHPGSGPGSTVISQANNLSLHQVQVSLQIQVRSMNLSYNLRCLGIENKEKKSS